MNTLSAQEGLQNICNIVHSLEFPSFSPFHLDIQHRRSQHILAGVYKKFLCHQSSNHSSLLFNCVCFPESLNILYILITYIQSEKLVGTMGGKVWSNDEESYFWHTVVTHSPKRVGVDLAKPEKSWDQLADEMRTHMGEPARRNYNGSILGKILPPLFLPVNWTSLRMPSSSLRA